MVYSRSHNIGFAHYPKTAGHSLGEWFQETFPDANFVQPPQYYDVSHLPARVSLERLGLVAARARLMENPIGAIHSRVATHLGLNRSGCCPTRIIGVLREPFQMLISLFEYWRDYPFTVPVDSFIMSAREGTFYDFLSMAVVRRCLPSYDEFFDVGGPAWPSTRLLDFGNIDVGLQEACREFGIAAPRPLALKNARPRRSLDDAAYRPIAGPLVAAVERHYRWYYRFAAGVMIGTGHSR